MVKAKDNIPTKKKPESPANIEPPQKSEPAPLLETTISFVVRQARTKDGQPAIQIDPPTSTSGDLSGTALLQFLDGAKQSIINESVRNYKG